MFELDTILWIEGWETKTRNESHHILKFEGELFQLSFGFFFFWELPVCYPDHRSSLNLLLAMAGVIVSCFD